MGRPSNLPSFLGLTEMIRDESELRDVIGGVHDQPLDEVMGDIEAKYDVDVHLRAMRHTAKTTSLPNSLHDAIGRLSRCGEVRVVTTNYDTHLSTVLGATVEAYLPPAFPMGNEFTGLVYLHGSITQLPKHLVVTASDFGRAYLTEAWATRFLERMFATYTTLFVGYSHNDVIMKYMARGLSPKTKPRYAFTHQPDSGMWRQLGIIPIAYSPENNHRALVTALSGWAQRASNGLLEHRRQIKAIMERRAPADLSPDDLSYLESVLADENIVQFFCAHAQGVRWLDWVVNQPEFRSLFDERSTAPSQSSWRLAGWFAQSYIAPGTSADALAVCRSFGGRLSPVLWEAIARRLVSVGRSHTSDVEIGPWLVALTRSAPNQPTFFLGMLLSQCRVPADTEAATLLFAYLTDPVIIEVPSMFGGLRGEVRLRGERHQLHDCWTDVFKPSLETVASELLPIVDQHMRKAQRSINLNEKPDAGETLGSPVHPIAAVSGGAYADHLDFLVEVARDCIESLLVIRPDQGLAQLSAWASSEIVLLKRLAIHGWTIRRDAGPVAQAKWLEDQRLMLAHDYLSELTPLLLCIIESDDVIALQIVVADILRHANDNQYTLRRAVRTLHWMRECSSSSVIDQALATLTAQHDDLRMLLLALESTSPPDTPPLTPADELALLLDAEDLTNVVALLDEYAVQDPPPNELARDDLQRTLSRAVTNSPCTGFDLLDIVPSENPSRPMTETSVIRGWSMAAIDDQLADLILLTASSLNISEAAGDIARMLAGFRNGPSQVEWARFDSSRTLARVCWEAIDVGTPEADVEWLHQAVNSPAGQLTIYWTSVVSYERQMTAELSTQITGMLTCGDVRADPVEVIAGHEVSFLHSIDADWSKEHILPLFDWADPERALRVWSGYLSGGKFNEELLRAGLLDGAIEAASNAHVFSEKLQHSLFGMLAQIALHSQLDVAEWLPRLVRNSDIEGLTLWANEVTSGLRTMDSEVVEGHWNRWIQPYWSARLQSVPRRLNFREASAMATWAIYLGQSRSAGVELALQCPAGLLEHSSLLPDLNKGLIERDPDAVAALLAHLLTNTELPYYGFGLADVVQQLRSRNASESSLAQISEHAFRLGLSLDCD